MQKQGWLRLRFNGKWSGLEWDSMEIGGSRRISGWCGAPRRWMLAVQVYEGWRLAWLGSRRGGGGSEVSIKGEEAGGVGTVVGYGKGGGGGGGIPVGQPTQQDQMGVMEKVLKRFYKQNPQIFRGTADEPLQAAKWLGNMERIFEVMECIKAQKVVCSSHVLLGKADIWWQTWKKIP
ncbi:hypothetical protein NE237_027027 [Protea cynaroides]|uniref:Uncharacterized protein n=1 Tax=Protea cynaroides TaxID=273540 RepID=A0A9Q0JTU0_9MAGN|nr:hypothetical protein NE237_027027 [Protea cynaroides]